MHIHPIFYLYYRKASKAFNNIHFINELTEKKTRANDAVCIPGAEIRPYIMMLRAVYGARLRHINTARICGRISAPGIRIRFDRPGKTKVS
jgi:hypothetical protein